MIVRLDGPDYGNMMETFGFKMMFIELDDKGFVTREIGINGDDQIAYKYPGSSKHGSHGIFDVSQFNMSTVTKNDISEKEFEELWELT